MDLITTEPVYSVGGASGSSCWAVTEAFSPRVIQEVKRETEISVEAESSAKISEAPEQTTTQDPSSLKPTSTDSTKRTTSQVDGRLPWTVRLCPCGLLFAYAPCL